MANIDQLLDRIGRLPTAPAILPPLLRALNEEETDLDKVVDLINLDPALTAKLLTICNSAYVGGVTRVNSIFDAVQQLGFQTVCRLVAAAVGRGLFTGGRPAGVTPSTAFWRRAVLTAFAAQFIAQDIGAELGTMFTAGLLQDLGKQILAGEFKEDYFRLLESGLDDSALIKQETGHFGMNHAETGSRLLERLHFAPEIVASIGFHHDPLKIRDENLRRLAAILNVGGDLAQSLDEERILHDPTGLPVALSLLNLSASHLSFYRELMVENMKFVEAMCRLN